MDIKGIDTLLRILEIHQKTHKKCTNKKLDFKHKQWYGIIALVQQCYPKTEQSFIKICQGHFLTLLVLNQAKQTELSGFVIVLLSTVLHCYTTARTDWKQKPPALYFYFQVA